MEEKINEHVSGQNLRFAPRRVAREDGRRADPAAGQPALSQQLSQQRLLFPSGFDVPLLFRPRPAVARGRYRRRYGRGGAFRRRFHRRRHHLDGAAAHAARRRRPRGRRRLPPAGGAGRLSGRRDPARPPHTLPAALPRRNEAATLGAAGDRSCAAARLQVGRPDVRRRGDARGQERRGGGADGGCLPHRLRHAHHRHADVPRGRRRA